MRDGDAGQHPRRAQVEPGRLLRLVSCVVLVCGAEVAALADFSGTGRAPSDGLPGAGAAEPRGAGRRRARRGQGLAGAVSPPQCRAGIGHIQGRGRGLPAGAPNGAAYSPERSVFRNPSAGPCPGPAPWGARVLCAVKARRRKGLRASRGARWEGTQGAELSLRGGNAGRGSARA